MQKPNSHPEDLSVDRRSFFRRILLRGIEQAEKAGHSLQNRLEAATAEANHAAPSSSVAHWPRVYLRPPGALPEADLAHTCSRSGACVRVCPAQCIRLEDGVAGGLPFIVARQSPCVVCEDLSCMKACPSGALRLEEAVARIHMGRAVVTHDTCLRHPQRGGADCRLCVASCPIGGAALDIDPDGRVAVRAGCIGCGVCEHACPTEPTSIWVEK